MKKVTVAILAIIYLTVSTGVAMNVHYCMGKFASVDLMHNSDKCGKCGMKTKGGCCKDQFKIVKLGDTHKLISNDIRIFPPVAFIHNFKHSFDRNLFCQNIRAEHINHSPPGPPGVSLNILYSVFRI